MSVVFENSISLISIQNTKNIFGSRNLLPTEYLPSKSHVRFSISAFSVASPPHLARRASNSMEPHGNVSFHRLGGRDHGDPLCNVMVTRSDKGWHCPECIHVATTKGNLKSHILSGRHKLSEKSFKCRFCDRSYSTRQSMQVHISTNHRYVQ